VRSSPLSWASFFERLDGPRHLGMMARTGRQLTVAQRPQFTAERLLRHGDLIFLPDPLAEVDDPPADHPVYSRHRAALDHGCQRRTVLIVQTRRLSWRLAVDQPLRAMRVEPEDPIPYNLQGHAADLGCLCAAASVIDHSQRQQPPNLVSILALTRNSAQRRRVKIGPQRYRSPHGEPPPVASFESDHARVGEPLNESALGGLGISPRFGSSN
jgi:hypothetical protein